jgi:hypothetical protein
MTFREGGAYDYDTIFRQIKERLQQAYDVARESGQLQAGTAGVNMANVDLEQLPAYEPSDGPQPTRAADREQSSSPSPTQSAVRDSAVSGMTSPMQKPEDESFTTPSEPPPDYEETQVQAVGQNLEDRLREEANRQ